MMQYLILVALPPPVLVAYKYLFKYDTISSPRSLASSYARFLLNLYSSMMRDPLSPRCLASSCSRFLLKSYSNMMHYPFVAALPHPLLCPLLMQSLLKYDAISYPSCIASSCARFLLNPYSNMMQYPLLAVLPPPVLVSY